MLSCIRSVPCLYSVPYTSTKPSIFRYYIAKVFEAGHSFKYFISHFPILSFSSLLELQTQSIIYIYEGGPKLNRIFFIKKDLFTFRKNT
jgi:hypothetical protein